ncbi:DUF6470 family protein [Alkalihalobacillus sp. AL-G]|uniref:DUF6470 family protein n=1 Tax=Alkalihalobacillus sp. AL-G TaxID=2926399 RepID=UPI00272A61A2|nr:DUF6470 family protein [Alkalihalobacillus sp. AL-G]WLD92973.1 DUF6470 family protein [Alkalihalobacillus sp. AL-G]
MQFPQIRMQSKPALIGMKTTEGKQTIEQPRAEQTIRQPEAKMTTNSTAGKLNIDQTQAWNDMNLKNARESIEEFARRGREELLAGIARRAHQGDQMMKIENSGNPIISQAVENMGGGMLEWNIGWIPSVGSVKINYQPGDINIQWQINKPIIEATPKKAHSEYERGSLETFLRQRNSLTIDFVT